MRAIIYARYSSDNQDEASIEDQIRKCEELIQQQGWTKTNVYVDRAISGATTLRPGYQALLSDARQGQFDILVSEGLDRLSRDQEATASLFKRLTFCDVKIVTRSEGEISELHVGLKSTMNQLFLKDLALKTHRGLEGRIGKGRSAGGRAYGYRISQAQNEKDKGKLVIEPTEAEVVVRIFRAFAAGHSPRAIARDLNADGIPGPSGRAWRDTTIRGHATRRTGILRNDLYSGCRVWNKLQYSRDPDTGKRVSRLRPVDEWVFSDVPELRIVDRVLWQSVQDRLDKLRNSTRSRNIRKTEFWKARRPKHLLTGLVHCGNCGNAMSSVGSDYLACAAARSGAGCDNRKGVRRSKIEVSVLEGLKGRLMAPELIAEFIQAFHAEVNSRYHETELALERDKKELASVTRKLEGLYDAIADGLRTDGLKARLERMEAQKVELEQKIADGAPAQPRLHPNLAAIYRDKVADLHASLSEPGTRTEAADTIRELIDRIDVWPEGNVQRVELTGDIVKLIALPDGKGVPDVFENSVKVVAGACNQLCRLFESSALIPLPRGLHRTVAQSHI